MTKKRPDNLGGDAIYIQVRPSEFKMRIIGKPAIEKYFVRIYSAQEFVFPELGRLNPDINLIDLNDYGGMCEAFYSIGAIGRQFSNMNQIVRELLKDNRGKLEYISQ
ncbi:hypothetical protein HY449_00800 [Candidatus Pacearchaeota archaeon]|nr:hypothetical protein [Candidatus Pacearchaeota archaeon]